MAILTKIIRWILKPQLIRDKLRSFYWQRRFHGAPHLHVNGRIVVNEPGRVKVGHHVSLNEGVFLGGKALITIGNWVHISPYVILNTGTLQLDKFGADRNHEYSPIVIEDGVWVGSNALINPGIRLGQDSVIGAGAVVTKDVPARAVVAGVPAKVLRMLDSAKDN